MIVYNVLFKGVEKPITPLCKVFRTFELAERYCEISILKSDTLKCMSTSGFVSGDENTPGSCTDYRCEDKEGNSYYFVIYVQDLPGVSAHDNE